MVTSISYGHAGWIGNLIVIPEYRNRGIGKELMVKAMNYLKKKGVKTIKLDAELRAVSLYRRLGFEQQCNSLRFSGMGKKHSPEDVEAMKHSHLNDVVRLDGYIFGADRRKVLKEIYQKFSQLCFVSYSSQQIVGYIMARERKGSFQIGPWICQPESQKAVEELLKATLDKLRGKKLRIGALELNESSVSMLRKYNFNEVEPSIRMVHGTRTDSSNIRGEYAIGSPDKG